jgi:hypothetical protein
MRELMESLTYLDAHGEMVKNTGFRIIVAD